MDEKKLPIGKVAKLLGISVDTLRRHDKSGAFPARKSPSGHRYYTQADIEMYRNDLYTLAREWVSVDVGIEPTSEFYCENQAVFQSRLMKMEKLFLPHEKELPWFSLLVSASGEIGNNSFDHNIGNWRDVRGIFYGYDMHKKMIVLADRGRGVQKTLRQVRPEIASDKEALHVAFTEIVSGRAPEARGNGLKYVRSMTTLSPIVVECWSGNAKAMIRGGKLDIEETEIITSGCLSVLKY